MSIFVVTTQAFTIDPKPVVVDWQYDLWGDADLAISNEDSIRVGDNSVTFSFTLTNNGPDIASLTVRVELVDENGNRVIRTLQSGTDPDLDAQWLVANTQTTGPILNGDPWNSGLFTFTDDKVDSTISTGTGGTYIIYASTGIDMDVLNMVPIERTPVFPATTQTIRATGPETATGWTNVPNAYDAVDPLTTSTSPTSLDVLTGQITFTWLDATGTDPGSSDTLDVTLNIDIKGFSSSSIQVDPLTITCTGGLSEVSTVLNINDWDLAPLPARIVTFDLTDPGGVPGWQLTEIQLISVVITGAQAGTKLDALTAYAIYDVYVTITPPP